MDVQGAETPKKPAGSLLRRFARDDQGVTIIEFAFLALPFFLLVFAILESCIAFAAQQVMANAADDISRQFRTGQIKISDNVDEAKLRSLICDRLSLIVSKDCPGLVVDLRNFNTFAEIADLRIKITPAGQIDKAGFDVDLGPSLSKNMLRVFYEWPVMTDIMRKYMSNLEGGKTLLYATAAWQNEPFND